VGIDYERIKNWPIPPITAAYTRNDTMRFARGVGAGMPGPLQAEDQKFLRDDAMLQALPMMAVVLNEGPMWTQDPATEIDWTQTIHAEECVTMYRPLAPEGELLAEYRIDEIYDKGRGKGALIYESRRLSQPGGTRVAELQIATFLRANGGFGGPSLISPKPHEIPSDRPPDEAIELLTPVGEAAIYALLPEFVDALKFAGQRDDQVMLRGACAFGIAGRGVLKLCCGNDPARLRKMKLRYAGPTFTGETVRIEVWHGDRGTASFQVRAVERNALVMKSGSVRFDA